MRYRCIVVLVVVFSAIAHAQWLNFPTPGTPLTPAGKTDLVAPTPRTADGKPDLSGTWMHELTSVAEMRRLFGPSMDERIKLDVPGMEIGTQHKYAFNIFIDLKPEEVSMQPAAAEILRRRLAAAYVPGDLCTEVPGFPVAGFLSVPIKIVQAPRQTIVLYEAGSMHRQIYSDGRSFPKTFEFPAFLGYSVGHWEGDVFVVVTAGFNDKTSLDRMGHPHSEALRVTERFRRTDFGHMDVEMTFEDPQMYTKPFTIRVPHDLLADGDVFETFCENEKDRVHIQNVGGANGTESKVEPMR